MSSDQKERTKKSSINKGPAEGMGKMERRVQRNGKAEPGETLDQWHPLWERENFIGI